MDTFIILDTALTVSSKSAELADKDPHGLIISLVSITMVFLSLLILFVAYTIIGRLTSGRVKRPKTKPEDEEAYAAIGMAMHQYLNEVIHDNESYTITIKRK